MDRITFPLEPRMRGTDVGNLQLALQLLLDRIAVLGDDEGAGAELAEMLTREHEDATYGPATQKVVDVFQSERALGVNGAQGSVDEATADALNAQLREWGLLDGENGRRPYVVSGQVRREDGLA